MLLLIHSKFDLLAAALFSILFKTVIGNIGRAWNNDKVRIMQIPPFNPLMKQGQAQGLIPRIKGSTSTVHVTILFLFGDG